MYIVTVVISTADRWETVSTEEIKHNKMKRKTGETEERKSIKMCLFVCFIFRFTIVFIIPNQNKKQKLLCIFFFLLLLLNWSYFYEGKNKQRTDHHHQQQLNAKKKKTNNKHLFANVMNIL